jgi:hypothetical protein
MDLIWIMILILLVALSIVGTVVWWALVIYLVNKGAQRANRQFEAQLRAGEGFPKQLPQMPAQQSTATDPRMSLMFSKFNRQCRDLDDLYQKQRDVAMSDLMNIAGSAGIDWTPPREDG